MDDREPITLEQLAARVASIQHATVACLRPGQTVEITSRISVHSTIGGGAHASYRIHRTWSGRGEPREFEVQSGPVVLK